MGHSMLCPEEQTVHGLGFLCWADAQMVTRGPQRGQRSSASLSSGSSCRGQTCSGVGTPVAGEDSSHGTANRQAANFTFHGGVESAHLRGRSYL